MPQLHFHPDGLVYVRTENAIYVDTAEHFGLDATSALGASLPQLPEGATERLYDNTPGLERHAIADAKGNQIDSGPIPWASGDGAITAVSALLDAQTKRSSPAAPAPAPTPAKGVTEF